MIEIKIPLSQLRKQLIGVDEKLENAAELLQQYAFHKSDAGILFKVSSEDIAQALKNQLSSVPSGPMRREILKQLGLHGDEYALEAA